MNEYDLALYNKICTFISEENVLLDEPMSAHTTFKVGGNAKMLIKITDEDKLKNIICYLNSLGEEFFIKGNGSNLLVSDRGYDGIIIEIASSMQEISVDGDLIIAKAGSLMSTIAKVALDNGLTGFEFASGIPGTIGGGVVMNAGAYDGELKDVVKYVKVMGHDGEIYTIDNKGMEFGYRTSVIKKRPFIVLEVAIELTKGDKDKILSRMNELSSKRREKQPLEYPSAGSTFKRPEGYFAGKLIMDAGLRGYSVGGAEVSEKHCGFVINRGNATATDIYDVILEVQDKVESRFGVKLEPEIIFLGSF